MSTTGVSPREGPVHNLWVVAAERMAPMAPASSSGCRGLRGSALPTTSFGRWHASSAHLDALEVVLPDGESRTVVVTRAGCLEHIVGTTAIGPADLESSRHQAAGFLRQLHDLDVAALALPALSAREDPLQGALDFLPSRPKNDSWRGALPTWGKASSCRTLLLHGDDWPGNLLRHDGQLAAAALATMPDWGLAPDAAAERRKKTTEFLSRATDKLCNTVRVGWSAS
ncbi:MAG: hypothetical protein ACRBN8_36455 [Nannocystales bacterium]